MKVFNFIAKLAILLIVLILIQGVITSGFAFDLTIYNWLGYFTQACFIILCIRLAMEDWGTWKN